MYYVYCCDMNLWRHSFLRCKTKIVCTAVMLVRCTSVAIHCRINKMCTDVMPFHCKMKWFVVKSTLRVHL